MITARRRTLLTVLGPTTLLLVASPTIANAGSVSAQGAVTLVTNRANMISGVEARFDEGPTSGNLPLNTYTPLGVTWRSGNLTSILAGVTTPGATIDPQYFPPSTYFPGPIANGGLQTNAITYYGGAVTFADNRVVTAVGLTAGMNGTQYLTAWSKSGTMIGQITWTPTGDSSFIGLASDVPIGMVTYGNDNLFAGGTFSIAGTTIMSDTWVFGFACDRDGVLDLGEQCDDGNATAGDGCSPGCRLEYCGNGAVEPGEVCDDSNHVGGDGCSADCKSSEICGNGFVDVSKGEACDDGNVTNGDGCQSNCALATCGDGVLDTGEPCDDDNVVSGDGCNATCTSNETCGNGVVDLGEACDDGAVASGDGCSPTCEIEICGNGTLDAGELCDDDNVASGDGCSGDCQSDETCGNGVVDGGAGEQCDDANTMNGDGCSAACALEYCGNGTVDPGEVCDDGDAASGDGCSSDCHSDETCGNNVVDVAVGEGCDDGNTVDGDGCQADCALTSCGDDVVDPGEVCDDGNKTSGDGCNALCTSTEACGNGVIDVAVGEQCDDSNTTSGDDCSSTCELEFCGNGTVDAGEVCDDGNTASADGCASDCGSVETCGNAYIDTAKGEQCDDGNTTDGDGCNANCKLSTCGDGVKSAAEACDDGNTAGGDGCNATCTSDETCGNTVVDSGEVCDLGAENGTGVCSSTCQVETPAVAEGGCDCSVDGRTTDSGAALAVIGLALALLRRGAGRRARRRTPA